VGYDSIFLIYEFFVKSVIRLLKVASKQASIDLRAKSPLECPCIGTKVIVSKLYFNHIAFSKRFGILTSLFRK
jgi:hypothetical protein